MSTTATPRPLVPATPPGSPSPGDAPGSPRTRDPRWALFALLGLLALTGVLYFWNLTVNGYANSFYSAAVQAGSVSWKAFFFGSSDAANSITVDKPPASLWVMALSVRLLGLSSFSILLPQVLMGIGTVLVVTRTVRRTSGIGAGLLAGAAMALTPVAVLMFRFNNPDALLVLLMALGAWATVRAIERGSIRWMALTGALIGLGFLTKTLQVFLVVPVLGLAFVLFAATGLRRRLLGALVALGSLVVMGGWWVAIVELIPASLRPYVGGSQDDSFLELTFGYNGLGRINGDETGSVGGGGGGAGQAWGSTGLGRMFSEATGGQISWLLPAALILLLAGLALRGRRPRTDLARAGLVVWGGWLLVTALTFSFMAGIFHDYYTVALAPAIAAVVGMGVAELWRARSRPIPRIVLAVAMLATGGWGYVLLSRTTEYGLWLRVLVLVTGILAAGGFLILPRLRRPMLVALIAAGLISAFAGQAAYAVTTVSTARTGSIVTAGPSTGRGGPGGMGGAGGMPGRNGGQGGGQGGGQAAGPQGTGNQGTGGQGAGGQNTGPQGTGGSAGAPQGGTGGAQGPSTSPGQGGEGQSRGGGGMGGLLSASTPSAEVVAALDADAGDYTWVAATIGSQNAAGLQLATGHPVMAIGGFNGSDPSPTLAQFQQYVADGRIHYLLESSRMGQQNGGSTASREILAWAGEHYATVTLGDQTFYDLTQPLAGATS